MKLLSPKTSVSRPAAATHVARRGSRPITDRVKESLFSVLYKYDLPSDKIVADLFCGVGSLGLEALSRGAAFATFVEKDTKVITILKKNIEKAGFIGKSKVIRANAFKIGAAVNPVRNLHQDHSNYRRRFTSNGVNRQKYDLVFVDPPYAATKDVQPGSLLSGLLDILSEQLAENGIVVVRTHRRTFLLDKYGHLQIIERRQWGTMAVTILSKKYKEKSNDR